MEGHLTSEPHPSIARAFVTARRAGHALPVYPGPLPQSLSEAYAIQDLAIDCMDREIVGWKVGKIEPPVGSVDRLSGPIFSGSVFEYRDTVPTLSVFSDGFAAAEAEFLLRIGSAPDPAKYSYSVAEAMELIDKICIGIEIASSPYREINDQGPYVTISDFGNNNGLVVGASIEALTADEICDLEVHMVIDGKDIASARGADMLDGPFGAARFLFEHMAQRGIRLQPGQWISTGAVTGVHEVTPGQHIVATFGADRRVECTVSATPLHID